MPLPTMLFRAALLASLLLPPGAPLLAASQQAAYPNTSNFGGPPDRGADWFRQCLRVQHRQPPARDVARPPLAGKDKSCNASKLYYDKLHQAATSQGEWDQVRECATAANDTTVLMMVYANGFGVGQDADLAIQYACSSAAAPAEMEERVMHLAHLAQGKRGDRFDQCDDITSGYMGGICASIKQQYADRVRTVYLARVRSALTAPQQASFDQLVKASNAFAQARGDDETDMTGTARVEMAIDAEVREQEWLREHLAAFEKAQYKLPAPEQFEAADAELNRAYQQLMQLPATDPEHPQRLDWSTVEKSGVRKTQRAWLAYRDAWLRFAADRYPAIAPASLKAALTQWRIKQLKRLAPG
jgi:uncharacterized protein YecT (DUF1311 family)